MKSTLNWCYGAKTPDIEQAVSDAIFAAHTYRNQLCALELEKRARHYQVLVELSPDYVAACDAVTLVEVAAQAVEDLITAEKVTQRTQTPKNIKHLRDRATALAAELQVKRAVRKVAQCSAYAMPAVIAALDRSTAQHKAARKQAKQASGLYWGTEATVTESCRDFHKGPPPTFKRYDGTGQLSVQLQGGLDCADAERYNTLCYLGDSLGGKRRECFIRIGSDNRAPVFACVPIVFHRALPAGEIKRAYLERRKIASHVRWTIRFTIDIERDIPDRPMPGEVAIHTGWRMEEGSLRVATWLASDGSTGTLRLSQEHCADYLRLDSLEANRAAGLNEVIAELRTWAKSRELPEFLTEVKPHLHLWKSQARLAKLVWHWAEARFDGDSAMFERLDSWRKTDKHLWQHHRRLTVRISRRRRDAYRVFAKSLSERYGVAILAPIQVQKLTKKPTETRPPEDWELDQTQSRRHAAWAAVSDLTSCIRERFPLRCITVSSVNMTKECVNCGEINKADGRKIQCRGCGQTYDCDDNAVANTLARGDAALLDGALLALVTEQELKEAAKQAKLVKLQEANNAARTTRQTDL